MTNAHLVFVYGSLKAGFYNHPCLTECGAESLGAARTVERYSMVKGPAYPFLIHARDMGGNALIAGEVYRVDDECLARLDRLESHPRFYKRELVGIVTRPPFNESLLAWVYFLNLNGQTLHPETAVAQPDAAAVVAWEQADERAIDTLFYTNDEEG